MKSTQIDDRSKAWDINLSFTWNGFFCAYARVRQVGSMKGLDAEKWESSMWCERNTTQTPIPLPPQVCSAPFGFPTTSTKLPLYSSSTRWELLSTLSRQNYYSSDQLLRIYLKITYHYMHATLDDQSKIKIDSSAELCDSIWNDGFRLPFLNASGTRNSVNDNMNSYKTFHIPWIICDSI